MKIDKSVFEDHATLTLKGEFDTFYCPRFQEEIESLFEQGINHVILNMRLVKFANSTALGAIIRAHKLAQAKGGELVVSRASSFVQKVISSLGIDQLISTFDDDDAAIKHITQSLNQRELAGDAPVEEEKVVVAFEHDDGTQSGKRKTLIGTMRNVDGQRLQFTWSGERDGLSTEQTVSIFPQGKRMTLKFQVKLSKKGHFEVEAEVAETTSTDDGVRVTAHYVGISKSDEAALTQFATDMAFLKQQLPEQAG